MRFAGTFSHLDDRIVQQLHGMSDEGLLAFAHALGEIARQSGLKPREIEKMLARGKSLADVFASVAVRLRHQGARKPDIDSGQLRRALASLE